MWRFLHIVSMFGAVSIGVGAEVFRNAILRGGDLQAIRRALSVEERLGYRIATPLFVAGVAFGFVAAVTMGFDLTAPWLVLAYVMLILIFVNFYAVTVPHLKRIEAAAEASEGEPSPQLQALLRAPPGQGLCRG